LVFLSLLFKRKMIVYKDMVSGDQILSDSFEQEPLVYKGEPVPGCVVVQSKMVNKETGDIDIGANASAEEVDEGTADQAVMVNQLVDKDLGFGYEGPVSFTKQEFGTLFKKWSRETKEKILEKGDKAKPFVQSAKEFVNFLNAEYKNFEIYQTASFSSFIIAWWDDAANQIGAPKFIFFTHAMDAEKY